MSTSDYDHGETVDRLLAEVEELTAGAEDLEEVLKDDDLQSLAVEARNLIEEAEPVDLLDAVGLDVSESDPGSLVRALAEADAESLIRLRRLQLLASVARDEGDDREALGEFEALSDVLDEGDVEIAARFRGNHVDPSDLDLFGDELSEESANEDEERDGSEDMVEGAIDAAGEIAEVVEDVKGDDEEAANEGKKDEEAAEEDTGTAEQIHSALSDMVDQLQEKAPDDSTQDAPAEEEELDEDEGNESSGSSKHSTMPSSDRADMRVPSRHSTMSK